MGAIHGKNSAFKLENASNVLTDITTYITSIDMPKSIEEAETTTLGLNNKTFVQGLQDATISLEIVWDETIDALLSGIEFMERDFEYYPAGLSGVKYSGACFMTSMSLPTSATDVIKTSVALRITGPVGRT